MGKKVKKVCFFSPASYHFFVKADTLYFGGAELQMFLIAKQLSENEGFEVDFLTGAYKQQKVIKNGNIKLVRSINLSANETFVSKLFKSIKYFFILVKRNPDIIITTTFNPIVGITTIYKRVFKKKHIHRIASNADADTSRISENGLSGRIFKYGLERADVVLCQNNEQKSSLKRFHNRNVSILKNAFVIKQPVKTHKKNILWVGRYIDLKKPELFLKLAEKLPNEKFVMICPYNRKDKVAWNKMKQKAKETGNITLIEKVPFDEIQNHFNNAKLFINTSDFEGFPNTFLQAAQGKTPIVSLNVNPDNFITEYNSGIFASGSFDKMLTGLKPLLQNSNELKIKGENLYQYLKENHNINTVVKQLEQIILDLK